MSVFPLSSWAILACEQNTHSDGCDDDKWDDEGDSPCDVRSKALVLDERIEDSGHNEISDSTTRVTPTTCQGVRCTDDILVEEASGPDLTRDEGSAEDTDEEAKHDDACWGSHETGHGGWDGACKQAADKDIAGTEAITERTSDKTNDKCTGQTHDVGVGILVLTHVEILANGEGE